MTAVAFPNVQEFTLNLEDLDLLDDEHRHARCILCDPRMPLPIGITYTALCGRRVIHLRPWAGPPDIPPDACPECVELYSKPCPRCGGYL